MKEIRLHGRGGQGVVKASQLVVKAAVAGGKEGQFIPFFGVERKGSPVFGYLRVSDTAIRRRSQVYTPEILVIMDDSLISMPETYVGLLEGGTVVINTKKTVDELNLPESCKRVAIVDAKAVSEKVLGRNMPNTSVLGAMARATDLVDKELLFAVIEMEFGANNREAAEQAYEEVCIINK